MPTVQPSGAIRSILASQATVADLAFSPDGKTLYVAYTNSVFQYDVATGASKGGWTIGAAVGAIDVSPDGTRLIATEKRAGPVTGSDSTTQTIYNIHNLNLVTGVVTHYERVATGADSYFYDVSFVDNGRVLLTQHSNTGATTPLTTLDLASGAFTASTTRYGSDGTLTASYDRQYISFAPKNTINPQFYIYQSQSGIVANNAGITPSGANMGVQAISRDGGLSAQANASVSLYQYNGQLESQGRLPGERNDAAGLAYAPGSDQLYVLDAGARQVYIYDQPGGAPVRSVPIGDVPVSTTQAYGNALLVSPDGRYLAVAGAGSIQIINLATVVTTGATDVGTQGDDVLVGLGPTEVVYAYGGNDRISTGSGFDTIYAGAGDDVITLTSTAVLPARGYGNIYGDAGNDTLDLSQVDSLELSYDQTGSNNLTVKAVGVSAKIYNVENFILGSGQNSVYLNTSGFNVSGGSGKDYFYSSGAVTLKGGAGDDIFRPTPDYKTSDLISIDGGDGNDRLNVYYGTTLDLLRSDNMILSNRFQFTSIEAFIVDYDGSSVTTILGSEGDDVFSSFYYATTSRHPLVSGGVVFYGRGGNDRLTGSNGPDQLNGGDGNDILDGGVNSSTPNGGSPFIGAVAFDVMAGGRGDDLFYVRYALDKVIEEAGEGYDTVDFRLSNGIAYTLFANVELFLFGTGNESIVASNQPGLGNVGTEYRMGAGNDRFVANVTSTVLGEDGDDVVTLGATNSGYYDGGAGRDTLVVYGVADVDLAAGTIVQGGVTVGRAFGFEEIFIANGIVRGSDALDILGVPAAFDTATTGAGVTFEGRGGNDILNGSVRDDILVGGDGDDLLNGSGGRDTMRGDAGNDVYYVDNAGDNVIELAGGGYDTVVSTIGYQLGTEVEALILSGTGAINGTGNALDNVLVGNDAANVLDGGSAGNDLLRGMGGDDILRPNGGRDEIDGGAGIDTLVVRGTRATTYAQDVGSGQTFVLDGDGVYKVTNVERVQFADGSTIDFALLLANPPTAGAAQVTSFDPGSAYGNGLPDAMTFAGMDALAIGNAAHDPDGVTDVAVYAGSAVGTPSFHADIFG